MTTATASAPAKQTKGPKRHIEDFEGLKLEYILKSVSIATLFGLEDMAKDIPYLNTKIPQRVYLLPGTEEVFKHPLVPNVQEHKFELSDMIHVLMYVLKKCGKVPYLFGLHGTGKSSTYEQIHARLGIPLVRIILGEDSEVIDLGGQMLPNEQGGMTMHYGLLVTSMRNGWSLQIDEWDLLPIRQQKMLNEVIENARFTVEITGEQVTAHPKWRVMVTANTNNTGTGNNNFIQSGGDSSVNDRFNHIEKFYLTKDDEREILKRYVKKVVNKHPKIADSMTPAMIETAYDSVIELMLTVAERVRNAHEESKKSQTSLMTLECTLSTRSLKGWIDNVVALNEFYLGATGIDHSTMLRDAFKIAFVNGVSHDEQEDVLQILSDSSSL
ncbi:Aerobic cobaltochelatase subunit CobS [Vibrio thalassae]|uniref:Aerobic cobaltochelatase subunit CobS n=1 Tax=Vibrio thalassae TaxID=1243014 RepID=A0A240EGQ6_9VIBR|nr:AAA family ATPase [Vibrio thalassae]SNX47877.1 Aerobic cobaltochelatase subunit CobS [Vibrio thalassae]